MTDLSAFDPQSFLNATTDVASEKRDPLPTDVDYMAMVQTVTPRVWQSSKDPSNPKSGLAFDIKLAIDIPPEVQQRLGLGQSTLTMNDSIFVDLNDQGLIDYSKGKNPGIRKYREATGTNIAGQPWAPRNLEGRGVRVRIKHEIYNDAIQERVAAVTKL